MRIRSFEKATAYLHDHFSDKDFFSVWGEGGVGKTHLVTNFLDELPLEVPRFWVEARGIDTWFELHGQIVRALGTEDNAPAAVQALQSPLSVIVVDFAESRPSEAIITALQKLATETTIVSISRYRPTGDGSEALEFRGLDEEELDSLIGTSDRALLSKMDGNAYAAQLVASRLELFRPAEVLAQFDEIVGPTEMMEWGWAQLESDQQELLKSLVGFEGEWGFDDRKAVGIVHRPIEELEKLLAASWLRRGVFGFEVPTLVRSFVEHRFAEELEPQKRRVFDYLCDLCSRLDSDPTAFTPVTASTYLYYHRAKSLGEVERYIVNCGTALGRTSRVGVLRNAIEHLELKKPIETWSSIARLKAGHALLVFREIERARTLIQEIDVETLPEDQRFGYHLVRANLFDDGDGYQEQIALARQCSMSRSDVVRLHEDHALHLRLNGRVDEATEYIEKTVSELGEDSRLMGEMACCYAAASRNEDAVSVFEQVIPKMFVDSWRGYFYTYQRANLLKRMGRFLDAIADYDEILKLIEGIESTTPIVTIARQRIVMAKAVCQIAVGETEAASKTMQGVAWLHPTLAETLGPRRRHIRNVLAFLRDGLEMRFDEDDAVGQAILSGEVDEETNPSDAILIRAVGNTKKRSATLRIKNEGREIEFESGSVSLGRRQKLRAIVIVLADAHNSGEFVPAWDLFEQVWPEFGGDVPQTGLNRLYLAMSRLRSAGLESFVETEEAGYRFRTDIAVEVL